MICINLEYKYEQSPRKYSKGQSSYLIIINFDLWLSFRSNVRGFLSVRSLCWTKGETILFICPTWMANIDLCIYRCPLYSWLSPTTIVHVHTLREESSQTNVILQYRLLASILSAVCSLITLWFSTRIVVINVDSLMRCTVREVLLCFCVKYTQKKSRQIHVNLQYKL